MKYLLIDTNIYFDFIVFRTKHNPPESLQALERMLNFYTAQLIVPEIVVKETNRHINQMVHSIGNNLKDISERLEKSYWLSFDEQGNKEFKKDIDDLNNSLKGIYNRFKEKELAYLTVAKRKINGGLFKNENSVIIPTTPQMITNVMKRKMFKTCPFHKDTESYGDALILETLFDVTNSDFFDTANDKIYFVSRNEKEFANPSNKDEFHEDIVQQLEDTGLKNTIFYSRFFYKTLKEEFNVEIADAIQFEEDYYNDMIAGYGDETDLEIDEDWYYESYRDDRER
ncbi:PIN domain-containing protein [Paenibacillus wynnii]|uniref:PIN domain-containing protein n=1 Tax=Paenibacillus wynnii TaxID=268407 RepID=UPI0027923C60|nr:PIN domain-containing protein [Paenibacillus wynnii]MDQ0194030.1 hypothetical protein [Paenibacillus wynnii]